MDYFEVNLTEPVLKKLELQKDFLTYLDEEGILEDLRLTAIRYEKTVGRQLKGNFLPPFRFQLKLDIIRLQEVSENLMNLFLKEPNAGINLAKRVIFSGVRLILSNVQLEESDIQVVPLVISLPITCEISDLLRYPSPGLECIRGVMMSKTTLVKYVRSSVFSCELQYCPRNNWQRYPENFGNICPLCTSQMEEDISSTDMGEQFTCQLISLEAYDSPGRFQVLNVIVKDELCTLADFCIGDEYKIAGKLTGNVFEAMNVVTKDLNFQAEIFVSELPKSILDLYNRVSAVAPNCPWSFVYALSSTLGSHLIPVSSFLHLKLGLMLSLCTQKNDEVPSPLVAIGPDSLNAQHLFHTAGKLAKRYVRHSIAHSYLGRTLTQMHFTVIKVKIAGWGGRKSSIRKGLPVKEEWGISVTFWASLRPLHKSGAAKPGLQKDIVWLEAGQLVLAATGVCNLGDWSKFKKEQANYICQTIESGQIVLNKGELGKNNLIDFVPLKCSVWTYWCHITTSKSHQLQLKTLINVFGMPFLADEKNEAEVKKICWKNLGKGIIGTSPAAVGSEEMREFINIINAKEVGLSDEASQLIRNYFVVSRSERPHCLPIGAIKTITSLAEAHARLALRNEVLYEDVIAVIYLYEEAISALFGDSMNPYSKLVWDQEEPIFAFMGRQLGRFKIWLEEYVST